MSFTEAKHPAEGKLLIGPETIKCWLGWKDGMFPDYRA
jgi:hypothetical protein